MADFNVDNWLKSVGVTEEADLAKAKELFGSEDRLNALKDQTLMRSDYSRAMDKVKRDEAEALRYATELAEWKTQADTNLTTALTEKQRAEVEAAALRAAMEQYNIEPPKGFDKVATAPPNPNQNAPDLSGYFKKDEAAEILATAPRVNAKMFDIAAEYEELTQKRFKGMDAFVQEAIQRQMSLDNLAEEKFKFQELRETKQKESYDLAIKKAADDREAQVRAELHMPSARPEWEQPYVITNKLPLRTPTETGNARAGVDAAVAAFNEGKYRDK